MQELIKPIKQPDLLLKILQYGHSHPKKREGILLFLSEYAEADSRNVLLVIAFLLFPPCPNSLTHLTQIRAAGGVIFLLDIIFAPKPKKHRKEALAVLIAMVLVCCFAHAANNT